MVTKKMTMCHVLLSLIASSRNAPGPSKNARELNGCQTDLI